MDLELVKKGLDYSQKRKKWVLVMAALGFSSYGAYRVYNSPSVVKKRERLMKFLGALASIAELLGDSAEAVGVISKDLKEFVQSDSDRIPSSLRQVSKIATSDEFAESLVRVTRAFTVGILRAYRIESRKVDSGTSFTDKALDKLFSPAGTGFASIVVGSFAKNMFMAIYADREVGKGSDLNGSRDSGNSIQRWVDVIAEDKYREVIGDCIQQFVSTMVTVYLDKTMDMNPYDEILSGLTNPKHEQKARELLASVCNGAIETLVKTSHQVLTNPKSNGSSDSNPSSPLPLGFGKGSSAISKVLDGQELMLSGLKSRKSRGNGWASRMSSTLAVPNNRRFVLDLTGRVTFETVRSFLEFSLDQLSEGIKRSIDVVHEEVVDKGREVYRFATTKSSTVMTICLSLWLHILSSPWSLVPP